MYLFNEKEYDKSLKVAKEGLIMFLDNKDLLNIAGWSCYNLKNYECAKFYFLKVYNGTKDENAAIGLAYIYLNTGEKEKAKSILAKLENSNNPQILVEVANIYEALGEDKKAEKIIENLEKKAIKMELPPEKDKEYELKLEKEIQDTIIPNPFIKSNLKMKDFTLKKKNIVKTSKVEFKKKIELIKRKLIMKKQQYLSNISFGGKFRYKSGDKGTTLLHVYTPFVKGELFLINIPIFIMGHITRS